MSIINKTLKSLLVVLIFASCSKPAIQDQNKQAIAPTKSSATTTAQLRGASTAPPKNVILMIGDGMGLTQITAGMIANNNKLELERCTIVGLIKTSSSDDLITDSAAGATAFASGIKTYNGAVGVDEHKNKVETIVEIAKRNNLSTALVASSSITHATPACFYAHQASRSLDEDIANDLLSSDVDIFMGGGSIFFTSRKDGRNLLNELKAKNYNIYNNVEKVSGKEDKVGVLLDGKQPAAKLKGRGEFLPNATEKTLGLLQNKNKGFFLMVEGSQIDWFGHSNSSDTLISEMIDFDNAIGKVLDFAEKDGETLVIITADHETGGYAIVGGDKSGKVMGKFSTGSHTATMVPVFAFGPGAENFSGIYENTEIFHKIFNVWLLKD
ncbi:MAG: alkaline phosphatase [Bacteroidota bacterium]|nr:alkaline phosphatase [Bacteroidota bacterium]